MAANRRIQILTLFAPVLLVLPADGQIKFLTLEQASSRTGADWSPAYAGEEVALVGQVSAKPFWSAQHKTLPIQDNAGYGLLLEGSAPQIEEFGPGDWVQTRGVINALSGLPVLAIRDIQKFQTLPPPSPRPVMIAELKAGRHTGVLVSVGAVVVHSTENQRGDRLTVGEQPEVLNISFSKEQKNGGPGLSGFHAGDRLLVTGVASQYCPLPPFNHDFELLLLNPSGITLVEKAWSSSSALLLAALFLIGGLLSIWWLRERRMAAQRRHLRALNQLVEQVIAATSPAEILTKLNTVVPSIAAGSHVLLYLYNRGSKVLESVPSLLQPQPVTIKPAAPEGAISTGVALCFRNRTLLPVPDAQRSPFVGPDGETGLPRSVMFVPMFAQEDLLGVMQVAYAQSEHRFGQEEQVSMQHLANQVATALRLQDQKSIREQLFRSERLAAGAQLISGVANELKSPLGSILELIGTLKKRWGPEYSFELETIRSEAQRASEIVARLVSFGKFGQVEARPVDINGLLLGLLRFRAQGRKEKGIDILPQILNQRVMVLGSQGQLEQVFLNLLVHAEQAAANTSDIAMSISTSLLAKLILIEISYHAQSAESRKLDPFSDTEAEGGVLGLGLCRAIIQSHYGEIRLVRVSSTQSRFEVELPVIDPAPVQGVAPGVRTPSGERPLTFLIVEPEAVVQKQLVDLLSKRGHRVIPVSNAEEATEVVRRLKFDSAMCSTRLAGLSWVEFYERVRHHLDSVVLLTDGYDTDLAKAFQGGEVFVISKPLDTQQVIKILNTIEERAHRSDAL